PERLHVSLHRAGRMPRPPHDLRIRHPSQIHLDDLGLVRLAAPDLLHGSPRRHPVTFTAQRHNVAPDRAHVALAQPRQILLRQYSTLVYRLLGHSQHPNPSLALHPELLHYLEVLQPPIHRHHHTHLLHRRQRLAARLLHAHHRCPHLTVPGFPTRNKKHLLRRR